MLGEDPAALEVWEQAATSMPDSLRAYRVLEAVSSHRGEAPPRLPGALEALDGALDALESGKPKAAIRLLTDQAGPERDALRLRALAGLGASGPFYREIKKFRAAYPRRTDDLFVLWRVTGRRSERIQRDVTVFAAKTIEGDDVEMLYRAWRLFILTGEENLAAAAGARIGRVERVEPLPGRLPWGGAMIRDLARAIFRNPDPVLPASASIDERIAIWTELSRLAMVAGEQERSRTFGERAVVLGGTTPVQSEPRDMPLVSLDTSQGRIALGGDTKRAAILNFWATWCAPCMAELPQLELMAQRFSDEGIDLPVIAVSIDQHRSDFERFLKENSYSAVAMGWYPDLKDQLGGEVLPTTYYIDSEGKIRLKREGYKNGETERLEALVRGYLE